MCSSTIFSTILLLHTFICTSWFLALVLVNGATFTVVNNCTQTIWPAISGSPSLGSTGFELLAGSNRVLQAPKRWTGRFWGRTGCTFNAMGRISCRTGHCDSGDIVCAITAITLAEFAVDSFNSMDFYDISLVQGFNLPMMIEPRGGSGQRCQSIGCTEDVNQLCPAELRTENGDACRHACDVFRSSACGPTYYSQLFKNACPMAFSYPTDNANTTFTCSAEDYVITFCPTPFSEVARKIYVGKPSLVGFWCIQTIPSDRPSMSKVVEMLEGSLESIQIPPKPFLFTPTSLEQELSPSASGDVEIESSTERLHDCLAMVA